MKRKAIFGLFLVAFAVLVLVGNTHVINTAETSPPGIAGIVFYK